MLNDQDLCESTRRYPTASSARKLRPDESQRARVAVLLVRNSNPRSAPPRKYAPAMIRRLPSSLVSVESDKGTCNPIPSQGPSTARQANLGVVRPSLLGERTQ